MAGNTPVKDDPEQLKNAENLWVSFTKGSKISIIFCAIVMVVLLLMFVPFG